MTYDNERRSRIEAASRVLQALCDGTERWHMTIPVHPDDPDILISTGLREAEKMLEELAALRARVAELEARWAAIPWLDIHLALYGAASALQCAIERDIGDEATIGKALTRFDALSTWLDANRPQEAQHE